MALYVLYDSLYTVWLFMYCMALYVLYGSMYCMTLYILYGSLYTVCVCVTLFSCFYFSTYPVERKTNTHLIKYFVKVNSINFFTY